MARLPLQAGCSFLEPGPVVLVTSAQAGERDVMVLRWYMVMECSPARKSTNSPRVGSRPTTAGWWTVRLH